MSTTFERVRLLVGRGDWQASVHGLQSLVDDSVVTADVVDAIDTGVVVEDYPSYYAGPSVLVLLADRDGPVHILWGLKAGTDRPAVIITAYRPDPKNWLDDNRTRR